MEGRKQATGERRIERGWWFAWDGFGRIASLLSSLTMFLLYAGPVLGACSPFSEAVFTEVNLPILPVPKKPGVWGPNHQVTGVDLDLLWKGWPPAPSPSMTKI
jgi:hypothetical protein